jgi:putative DNA primase/helicase
MHPQVDIGWKGGLNVDKLIGPARGWHRGEAKALGSQRQQYNPDTEQPQGAREIAQALAARMHALAPALLGEPSATRGRMWRWGNRGSMAVHMEGVGRGRWYSFEEGHGGDALDLIAWARGCNLRDAIAWARDWLGEARVPYSAPREPTRSRRRGEPNRRDRSRTEYALRLWSASAPLCSTPAETYLRHRGVRMSRWPEDVRYHPRCTFEQQQVSCVVALVRDIATDIPCAIHRTALKPDGSGKLPIGDSGASKKALGPVSGGAVKLTPDVDVTLGLGICEGIETGLTLLSIGLAVWCTLGTAGLTHFPVLSGVESLTIFADNDVSGAGLRAARACADRWIHAGKEVRIFVPRKSGCDWNDVARSA